MTFIDCLEFFINHKTLQNSLSFIANIIALLGIPYSIYTLLKNRREFKENREKQHKEERRKNQEIHIFLKDEGGRKIGLPNTIRRGDLTRSEVLGRLGMIPIQKSDKTTTAEQPRFEMRRLVTAEFIRKVDALHVASEGTELIVDCKAEEMGQFDIIEIKKLGFELSGFDE